MSLPIAELQLKNFRNVQYRALLFSTPEILFLGKNGAGKTNLLESIYFFSILRSFRAATPRELVTIGENEFYLFLRLVKKNFSENLFINETASGHRKLRIGDSVVRKASDFVGEFRAVAFTPEDKFLVSGSAGYRRRFFDVLISPIDRGYFSSLIAYNTALEQRNRALKSGNSAVAAAFEPELAERAPEISLARARYGKLIETEVNTILHGRHQFTLRYRGDTVKTVEERLAALAASRERDMIKGATSGGPQVDEFELFLNDKPLRGFGSTGQIRIISLMLKMAAFNLVRGSGDTPVVALVDDVTGELDSETTEFFFKTVAMADQCFFTFAAPPDFNYFSDYEKICVPQSTNC